MGQKPYRTEGNFSENFQKMGILGFGWLAEEGIIFSRGFFGCHF
jgi:hypothetical protein